MTSKKVAAGACIGLLLGLLMLWASARAQGRAGFLETFDDPALPGWDRSPQATAADGFLEMIPGGYVHRQGEWGDQQVTILARRLERSVLVIGLRVSGSGAHIIVLRPEAILFQKEVQGEMQELRAPLDHRLPQNQWFEIRLTFTQGSLALAIQDQELVTYTDADPLPPGGFSLETLEGGRYLIDEVRLEPLGEESPEEPLIPGTRVPVEGALPLEELSWVRTGGPLGGLGYDVRMRPENPDKMYVTDAYSGVFISNDGGRRWHPSNRGIIAKGGPSGDAIPIFSLTIDPHDSDNIWAGTQNTRGIYLSTDAGETWTERVNGVREKEGVTFRGFTIDPTSSDIVYAAAEISSWTWAGEERQGREFDMTQGVVYKTTNQGESWTAVWRGDNLARYVWIDPRDPQVLYLSTGIFDREAANSDPVAGKPGGEGVLKSTDGGETWAHANNGLANLYVGSLFMHPQNPDILLAGTGNNQYHHKAGVYLSIDGATTWEHVLRDDIITSVEFAASDPNIAYAGSAGKVYRSQDGGRTWTRVSGKEEGWGAPGIRAGFPIDFQVDPRDVDRIFANNYGGGNFLSLDGGRTWTDASAGYTGAQVRDVEVDPSHAGRVYAAARSGLFVSHDGGSTWHGLSYDPASVLEWYAVAVDPAKPQHILAANNWLGHIVESHDAGQSWTVRDPGMPEGQSWRKIAFNPSDSGVVYAGTAAYYSAGTFDNRMPASGVYTSNDGGSSWRAANDQSSQDIQVAGFAFHPSDPGLLYVASSNRGLFKTSDGGQSWQELQQGLPPNAAALSVAIHPQDISLVYAGLSFGGLYRSRDAGASWQQVSAGLNPEAMVSSIVFHPTDPASIFLADHFSGVYLSQDGGLTWRTINKGLRTRAVNDLSLSEDGLHMYAGTEGEGVFRLDLNGIPPDITATPAGRETEAPEPGPQVTQPPADQPPERTQAPQPAPEGTFPCPSGLLPLAFLGVAIVWRSKRCGAKGKPE